MDYDPKKLRYTSRSVAEYFNMSYAAFRKMTELSGLSNPDRSGYTQEDLEYFERYRNSKHERSKITKKNAQLLEYLQCSVNTVKYPISVVAEYYGVSEQILTNCIHARCRKDIPPRYDRTDPGYTFDEVAIIGAHLKKYINDKVHNLKVGRKINLYKFNNLPVIFVMKQKDLPSISDATEILGIKTIMNYHYISDYNADDPEYLLIVKDGVCEISRSDQDIEYRKFRSYACYYVSIKNSCLTIDKFLGDIERSTYINRTVQLKNID